MNDYLDIAREQAAQCWGRKETENKVMDPTLCEEFAKCLANWIDTAAQNQRNTEYYRGLVDEIGLIVGKSAFISDDGVDHINVLCAKVPELVKSKLYELEQIIDGLTDDGRT